MGVDLYVSTSGSDSNPGTSGQPLATVGAAVRAVRTYGGSGSSVNLFEGTHRVSDPVVIQPVDSGLTFRGVGDLGDVIVRGSRVLTGWTLHSGSIYKVSLSGIGTPFFTLYENGVRARMARTPKLVINPSFPMARAGYRVAEGVSGSHTVLQYVSGDLNPAAWSLAQASAFMWSGAFDWFSDTIPVTSLNVGARQFTLQQASRYEIWNAGSSAGSRYFMQGVLDLLTEAGEFFYDGATLYYWAVNGATPNDVTMEVPLVYDLFRVQGDSATSRTQDVTFDGLVLDQTDMVRWMRHAHVNDGDGLTDRARGPGDAFPGYDRQMTLPQNRHGIIYLSNASGCEVSRCHLKNSGTNGIYGENYNQGHTIADSWIEHTGSCGVYLDGTYPGTSDVCKSNTISDVKVNNCGELVGHGSGIILANASNNTISHVETFNTTRFGVALYAYTGLGTTNCYSRNNLVEYTEIYDVCQDSGDCAGLYVFGFSSTVAPYNVNTFSQITVDNARAHASMIGLPPWGVYTDNETSGQVLSNVKVTNQQATNPFQDNNTPGTHTLTNTSFKSDGTTNGSFNPALMSPAIGLTGSFPF